MRVLLVFLALVLARTSFAAVDPAEWQRLVDKTLKEGALLDSQMGPSLHLARIRPPDESLPRRADYFTLNVVERGNGYAPRSAALVFENWSLNPEGNWEIRQDLYWMSTVGELQQAKRVLIELANDENRTVLRYEPKDDSVTDPATTERYEAKLNEWFKETR